jgi:hypothetical protein
LSFWKLVDESARPFWIEFRKNVIEQKKWGFATLFFCRHVDSEAQRQGQRSLFSLRRLGSRISPTKEKFNVIAMRADACHPSSKIISASRAQPVRHSFWGRRRVANVDALGVVASQGLIRVVDGLSQARQECSANLDQSIS